MKGSVEAADSLAELVGLLALAHWIDRLDRGRRDLSQPNVGTTTTTISCVREMDR